MSATRRQRPQVISALPVPVDLLLYAGDAFAMTLRLTSPAGDPIDLEDQHVWAQVRPTPESEMRPCSHESRSWSSGSRSGVETCGRRRARLRRLSFADMRTHISVADQLRR